MVKNNKKIIAALTTVVVLLTVVIAVGSHFFFNTKKDKPVYAFESNMETIISGKYDENFRYISLDGKIIDGLSYGDVSSTIIQNIDYKLMGVNEEKDYAVITAEFTYPDVVAIHNEVVSNNPEISDEELLSELSTVIEMDDFPTVTCTTEIPLIYFNDAWYIVESEQFNDIITGGIYSEYVNQNEKIYQAFKEIQIQEEKENENQTLN